MRYVFGLVGMLAVLGVIVYLMGDAGGELEQAKTALDTGAKIRPQLNQIAGRDADGTPANLSAALSPQMAGGKLRGLLVSELTAGGAYETHFGLKQYDLIVQIGPMDLRMLDSDTAQAQMLDAYQRNQTIIVERGKERLTLPVPTDKPKGLQGQLEGIEHIPTH